MLVFEIWKKKNYLNSILEILSINVLNAIEWSGTERSNAEEIFCPSKHLKTKLQFCFLIGQLLELPRRVQLSVGPLRPYDAAKTQPTSSAA